MGSRLTPQHHSARRHGDGAGHSGKRRHIGGTGRKEDVQIILPDGFHMEEYRGGPSGRMEKLDPQRYALDGEHVRAEYERENRESKREKSAERREWLQFAGAILGFAAAGITYMAAANDLHRIAMETGRLDHPVVMPSEPHHSTERDTYTADSHARLKHVAEQIERQHNVRMRTSPDYAVRDRVSALAGMDSVDLLVASSNRKVLVSPHVGIVEWSGRYVAFPLIENDEMETARMLEALAQSSQSVQMYDGDKQHTVTLSPYDLDDIAHRIAHGRMLSREPSPYPSVALGY